MRILLKLSLVFILSQSVTQLKDLQAKDKLSCGKALGKSGKRVMDAFICLTSTSELSSQTVEQLEMYVCQLYAAETKLIDVGKLWWQLFMKTQAEAEQLPSTKAALTQHIKCSSLGHSWYC